MAEPEVIRRKARELLLDLLQETRPTNGGQARKVTYRDFFPVDLKTIVTSILGWKLRPLTDYDQRAKSDFEKRVIFLNLTGTSLEEKNFSLAHEIGHAVLHESVVECHGGSLNRPLRSVRRGIREPQPPKMADLETDTDQFAAELLMPRKPVREHFVALFGTDSLSAQSQPALMHSKLGAGASPYAVAMELAVHKNIPNVPSLAEQFGASRSAMAMRLVRLGLVRA